MLVDHVHFGLMLLISSYMGNKITIIIIVFITTNISVFSQNRFKIQDGYSIGLNLNIWQDRYLGKFFFQQRFLSKVGYYIAVETGQFGKFIADGKTKKWFGHVDYPGLDGRTFYKSNNLGIQASAGLNYEFNVSNFMSITPSIYFVNGIYKRKYNFDGGHLSYITGKYEEFSGHSIEYNFAIGLDIYLEWLITKHIRLLTGFNIPFYLLNPNDLDISTQTHHPLRGTNPTIGCGIKYNFLK